MTANGLVLVIGESLIDVVRDGGERRHPGGSPMNVAYGLGRLGVATALLTHLADDADGALIRRHLESGGATLAAGSVSAVRTGTAVATPRESGSMEYEFDLEWRLPSSRLSTTPTWIHIGSIATFLEPGAGEIERLLAARAPGTRVSYDPNIRPTLMPEHRSALERFERLVGASDVVKLSDEDAAWLYPGMSMTDVIHRLLTLGPEVVALTQGEHGARLSTVDHDVHFSPPAITVVDTIGAGDSFMSAMIATLVPRHGALDARDLNEIVRTAATAATITCTREGALPPTAVELAEW